MILLQVSKAIQAAFFGAGDGQVQQAGLERQRVNGSAVPEAAAVANQQIFVVFYYVAIIPLDIRLCIYWTLNSHRHKLLTGLDFRWNWA
ncbi:MAG: hypothetical protein Alpg2KO_17550 [Alphaproteobacteria bacterium]